MQKSLKFLIIILSSTLLFLSFGFSANLKSEITTINNSKIHYYHTVYNSNKPNLIMLTGRGTTANFWPKDFMDTLSKNITSMFLTIGELILVKTHQNLITQLVS